MGFVKTPEEVKRIEAVMKRPRFVGAEMLMLEFLTRPETVADVLPPGLEPAGRAAGDRHGGALALKLRGRLRRRCALRDGRHGEIEAPYVLAMFMDQDHAIIFGRDLFGEPKKQATTRLQRRGEAMHGYVERLGTRVIEIEATLPISREPSREKGANFNIKALPSCTGAGLEDDPVLTLAEFDNHLTVRREGNGHARAALHRARPAGRHRGLRGARRLLHRGRPVLHLPPACAAPGR